MYPTLTYDNPIPTHPVPRTSCKLKKKSMKTFPNLCDWIIDNKLISIHFGKTRSKSIIFASKPRAKNIRQLNIKCKGTNRK